MPGGGTKKAVVLDTNALLLPFLDGIDLEERLLELLGPVRLVVPESVRHELEGLQRGTGATAAAARAAGRFLARCIIEATDLPGDDGLLDVARRMRAVVLTNDRRLQAEARRSGLAVVAPRGKGRLHRLG